MLDCLSLGAVQGIYHKLGHSRGRLVTQHLGQAEAVYRDMTLLQENSVKSPQANSVDSPMGSPANAPPSDLVGIYHVQFSELCPEGQGQTLQKELCGDSRDIKRATNLGGRLPDALAKHRALVKAYADKLIINGPDGAVYKLDPPGRLLSVWYLPNGLALNCLVGGQYQVFSLVEHPLNPLTDLFFYENLHTKQWYDNTQIVWVPEFPQEGHGLPVALVYLHDTSELAIFLLRGKTTQRLNHSRVPGLKQPLFLGQLLQKYGGFSSDLQATLVFTTEFYFVVFDQSEGKLWELSVFVGARPAELEDPLSPSGPTLLLDNVSAMIPLNAGTPQAYTEVGLISEPFDLDDGSKPMSSNVDKGTSSLEDLRLVSGFDFREVPEFFVAAHDGGVHLYYGPHVVCQLNQLEANTALSNPVGQNFSAYVDSQWQRFSVKLLPRHFLICEILKLLKATLCSAHYAFFLGRLVGLPNPSFRNFLALVNQGLGGLEPHKQPLFHPTHLELKKSPFYAKILEKLEVPLMAPEVANQPLVWTPTEVMTFFFGLHLLREDLSLQNFYRQSVDFHLLSSLLLTFASFLEYEAYVNYYVHEEVEVAPFQLATDELKTSDIDLPEGLLDTVPCGLTVLGQDDFSSLISWWTSEIQGGWSFFPTLRMGLLLGQHLREETQDLGSFLSADSARLLQFLVTIPSMPPHAQKFIPVGTQSWQPPHRDPDVMTGRFELENVLDFLVQKEEFQGREPCLQVYHPTLEIGLHQVFSRARHYPSSKWSPDIYRMIGREDLRVLQILSSKPPDVVRDSGRLGLPETLDITNVLMEEMGAQSYFQRQPCLYFDRPMKYFSYFRDALICSRLGAPQSRSPPKDANGKLLMEKLSDPRGPLTLSPITDLVEDRLYQVFATDKRCDIVFNLLRSDRCMPVKDLKMGDQTVEIYNFMMWKAHNQCSLPMGRGAFLMGSYVPDSLDLIMEPDLVLGATCPQAKVVIPIVNAVGASRQQGPQAPTPNHSDLGVCLNMFMWGDFQNGCAAALQIQRARGDLCGISRSWILAHQPLYLEGYAGKSVRERGALAQHSEDTQRLIRAQNRDPQNTRNTVLLGTSTRASSSHMVKPCERAYLLDLFRHGGFLLGLGLRKLLKPLLISDCYHYLRNQEDTISVGIILGMCASNLASMDTSLTRLVCLHLPSLMPWYIFGEMEVSPALQVTSIFSLGLLYLGCQHRMMCELLILEFGKTPRDNSTLSNRESYILACGAALGLICLGKGQELAGLADLQLTEHLVAYVVGGKRKAVKKTSYDLAETGNHTEDLVHRARNSTVLDADDLININITASGALIALACLFMKSGSTYLVNALGIPKNMYMCRQCRPAFVKLKVITQSLILWDQVSPTDDWVRSNVPGFITEYLDPERSMEDLRIFGLPEISVDWLLLKQVELYILAGALFSLGLRYPGTGVARDLILNYINEWRQLAFSQWEPGRMLSRPEKTMDLDRPTILACLSTAILALGLHMAGTGDLACTSMLKSLRKHADVKVPYGVFSAINQALGYLYLGLGKYTFRDDNSAIAFLLISTWPCHASNSADNRSYFQVLRNFYPLAAKFRCFGSYDVYSNEPEHSYDLGLSRLNGKFSFKAAHWEIEVNHTHKEWAQCVERTKRLYIQRKLPKSDRVGNQPNFRGKNLTHLSDTQLLEAEIRRLASRPAPRLLELDNQYSSLKLPWLDYDSTDPAHPDIGGYSNCFEISASGWTAIYSLISKGQFEYSSLMRIFKEMHMSGNVRLIPCYLQSVLEDSKPVPIQVESFWDTFVPGCLQTRLLSTHTTGPDEEPWPYLGPL